MAQQPFDPMTNVRVYHEGLYKDLLTSSSPVTQTGKAEKSNNGPTKKERERERAAQRHKLAVAAQEQRNAEAQARFREMLESRKAQKDAEFEHQFEKLREGARFVDSIDKFIEMSDKSAKQKAEKLHLEWEQEVFARVQQAVAQNLDSIDRKALNKERREAFDAYLAQANSTTGGLFLDSLDGDGTKPKMKSNKVKIGHIKDPSRRVLDKALEEQLIFEGKSVSSKKPEIKERDVLDITQWASGQIEATPHGHFSKMMHGKPRKADSKSAHVNKSNVNFDHYDVYKGPELQSERVHGSKRTFEANAPAPRPF